MYIKRVRYATNARRKMCIYTLTYSCIYVHDCEYTM